MLIKKATLSADDKRLELLLKTYENNLLSEVFFIRNNEPENLLELLRQQEDLLVVIGDLSKKISIPLAKRQNFQRRFEAAEAVRASNRNELADRLEAVKTELGEMNSARQRIRQMRQISKSTYYQQTPTLLQDWAWFFNKPFQFTSSFF